MITDIIHDRRIALADCNNFFVSCERRVSPSLDDKPVVVLSCNDGCVISRSNEVKKLGVAMGAPYFKIKDLLLYNNVVVRSTNMPLYQEISAAVMKRIALYTDTVEIYSIDESFFNIAISSVKAPDEYCAGIRKDIWKNCRIPVSIGIAPTKTLAKLGTEYAKTHPETRGVCWVDAQRYGDSSFMSQFSCRDIWGIGRKTAEKLRLYRVNDASQFMRLDDMWIKKNFGITSMYCAWELRGHQAYSLNSERRPPKSIMVSRSFGEAITTFEDMLDPLLCFTVSAARQLRKSGQGAYKISVYISTSKFTLGEHYSNVKEITFSDPKTLDSDFIAATRKALSDIFLPGYLYKKCGVILSNFSDTKEGVQQSLFEEADEERKLAAMKAVDSVNKEGTASLLKPAALFSPPDTERKWAPKSEFRSDKSKKDSPLPDGLRFQSHAEDCLEG